MIFIDLIGETVAVPSVDWRVALARVLPAVLESKSCICTVTDEDTDLFIILLYHAESRILEFDNRIRNNSQCTILALEDFSISLFQSCK